jgi:hypothetical protein
VWLWDCSDFLLLAMYLHVPMVSYFCMCPGYPGEGWRREANRREDKRRKGKGRKGEGEGQEDMMNECVRRQERTSDKHLPC